MVEDLRQNILEELPDRVKVAKQGKLPEQGEVSIEMMKDKPEVHLKKWNGEVDLVVRHDDVIRPGVRGTGNRMEYTQGQRKVRMYPLEEGEGMEDGGLEFEIELANKPAKNTFDFVIEGAENLDFFYQSALTQQEIDEGASRPENVVGSYAVYHNTKTNHQVGSTNYATGKAFHVYRPKAIDANGVEEWAELSYQNGVLTVTVPQTFLDNAVYPVIIDPTFGYTTLGGSAIPAAKETSDNSIQRGRSFNLSEDGTLDSLHIGLKADSNDTVDTFIGLYREDSAGTDSHDLVASTETLELSITTSAQFFDMSASSETIVADDYILAGLGNGEDVVSGDIDLMYDVTTNYRNYFENTTGAGGYTTRKSEDPWGSIDFSNPNTFSIYATYTASGGGGAEPPARSLNLLGVGN